MACGAWVCGLVDQVLLCAYMIYGTVEVYLADGMSLVCNPFDADNTRMAFMLWVFYLSKILDFCDTVFIVARRAWSRFTFLHIYHHAVRGPPPPPLPRPLWVVGCGDVGACECDLSLSWPSLAPWLVACTHLR